MFNLYLTLGKERSEGGRDIYFLECNFSLFTLIQLHGLNTSNKQHHITFSPHRSSIFRTRSLGKRKLLDIFNMGGLFRGDFGGLAIPQ